MSGTNHVMLLSADLSAKPADVDGKKEKTGGLLLVDFFCLLLLCINIFIFVFHFIFLKKCVRETFRENSKIDSSCHFFSGHTGGLLCVSSGVPSRPSVAT